ncbi:hypothetical protein L1987_87123 [Smallanthus sonchifolius]|nr:hypothetical protein L1987_87123 [Smallanthus sonchifolius]
MEELKKAKFEATSKFKELTERFYLHFRNLILCYNFIFTSKGHSLNNAAHTHSYKVTKRNHVPILRL